MAVESRGDLASRHGSIGRLAAAHSWSYRSDNPICTRTPELRFHALGVTNSGHHLHVTFTLRGENTKIRVISARDMHRKERSRYEKET